MTNNIEQPNEQRNKCVCGEQDIIGDAEVEIGGVCHRPNNPCYVIAPPQPTMTNNFIKEIQEGAKKDFEEIAKRQIFTLHGKKGTLENTIIYESLNSHTSYLITHTALRTIEEVRKIIGKHNCRILNEFQLQGKADMPIIAYDERVCLVPAMDIATKETLSTLSHLEEDIKKNI